MLVDDPSGRMMNSPLLLRDLWRAASAPSGGWTDGRLLDQFTAGGSAGEAAFDLIVRRHGPMILRVCRGALGEVLADDAFQATFLVLVRRVGAARRARCLDAWLFGIARRVCAAARRAVDRRLRHECRAAVRSDAAIGGSKLDPDVVAAVHAEVAWLPAGERAAVVLCDLSGLTYAEAADRLGQSLAAVRSRLARGRNRLRRRLIGRGFGPEAVWAAPVALPAGLVAATGRAAMVMAGRAAGAVPASVSALFAGGLESMLWTKCKAAGLAALTAGVLMAGAVGLSARQTFDKGPSSAAPADPVGAKPDYPARPTVARDSRTTPAADRADVGDDLAALVRRAQRQQDRGDIQAALATLDQVEEMTRRWRAQLADQARRAEALDRTRRDNAVDPRMDMFTGSKGPAVSRLGRGADVEDRLAAVEAKLDRLLRAISREGGRDSGRSGQGEKNSSMPGGRRGEAPPEKPGATGEFDREPGLNQPRDGKKGNAPLPPEKQ
jgi:RNA polymerase sigma factor (sigma-70 family)